MSFIFAFVIVPTLHNLLQEFMKFIHLTTWTRRDGSTYWRFGKEHCGVNDTGWRWREI